jgi:hypothetical protein
MEQDMFVKRRKVLAEDEDEGRIDKLLESYVPLSNLPTPPMSKEASPRTPATMVLSNESDMTFQGMVFPPLG